MSAQTIYEAFLPAEVYYRAQVMKDTWGHLAPNKNKSYYGYVVFAVGCYGSDPLNPTILDCEFKGLPDSPWFFDALADFIGDGQFSYPQVEGKRVVEKPRRFPEGGVYRFDGVFMNYEFIGTIERLRLVR